MGFFDNLFRTRHRDWDNQLNVITEPPAPSINPGVQTDERLTPYNNKDFLFNGEIKNFNVNDILINPEKNMQRIWQLCSLYSNADPLVHSIIYNCFVAYLTSPDYYLDCTNNKTIKIYKEYYDKIRLREKLEAIITELMIYGQAFIYVMPNGVPVTMPHNKLKISNLMFDGRPVVWFNCEALKSEIPNKGFNSNIEFIPDYNKELVMTSYPVEIQEAVRTGQQYAQLNPNNMFTIQLPKEGWRRYAVPWIVSALPALQKKALIEQYEKTQLSLGCVNTVHVKYGDTKKDSDMLPDVNQLREIRKIFLSGFKSSKNNPGLAVTNHLANAEIINKSIGDLYQWPLYDNVNQEICTAAGIGSIIATGSSTDGSTFSSAQISTKALEARLDKVLSEIEELMDRLNERFACFIDAKYNMKVAPAFRFKPVSLSGKQALREEVLKLYKENLVSAKTTLETYGYNNIEETENIGNDLIGNNKKETEENITTKNETENEKLGRPVLNDDERISPVEQSNTGNPRAKLE